MKKYLIAIAAVVQIGALNNVWSQQNPAAVNCDGAVPGCDLPSFYISTDNSQNYADFGSGSGSNPSTNPNPVPGNSGCLLSGETTSTFITINVVSSGTLEWSIQAPQTACLDWIMWPYNGPSTCADLQAETQPPVACNWNGNCSGFTGMANPGNMPPGAVQPDFEYGLPVVAGEQYLLCLSNYSGISAPVDLSFFGSANVSCSADTPDQTICAGSSATVDITVSAQVTNPSYNWLVTTGVSNPTGGTGVIVTPPVTTEYVVEVTDPGLAAPILDTFLITVVDPPTPDAGPDQTVCLGDVIQLAGVPSDPTNNTSLWLTDVSGVVPAPTVNFAPNFQDMNAQVTVNQVGTYLFILRETNTICGDVFDTVEVVVSELQISATTVAPSCVGYADGEIHIDSPEAVEYSFDGGTVWVADSFDVVFAAGNYDVCARSATGCTKCVNIDVVDPAPVTISVSNDTLICENGTAYMAASATGGTSYQFHWDHTLDTQATQDVNPLAATTYTVYAENQNGCVSPNETIDVTVRDPLTGTISPWDTICPGYPTDIFATVTGGIGTPYDWTWSSGETMNGAGNMSITVNPPSTQDYTVTITDGCESTPLVMTTNIYVAPLPVPQYEVLDPEQCEPAVFHIVNTTDPALSQYNYWLVDDQVQFINQDTIETQELMHGSYDLQMIITSYLGCVDSLTFEDALNVKPRPQANFGHSPNPVQMFNTNVYFTNTSFLGYEYQWYFEGGMPSASNLTNPHVQFPDGETGTYEVILVTTSELGCVDTMVYDLIVFPEILIYAPNAFTPDGDEFNQNWKLHIQGVDIYDFELLIYNRWGELIWENHDPSIGWDGTHAGRDVPEGTYNWIMRTKDLMNDAHYTQTGHINLIR